MDALRLLEPEEEFSLRVAPVVPFAILNPVMGLSSIGAWTFFWVSALGMAAGSAAYALAGAGVGAAAGQGAAPAATWLVALMALALLPWGLRWAWRQVHS